MLRRPEVPTSLGLRRAKTPAGLGLRFDPAGLGLRRAKTPVGLGLRPAKGAKIETSRGLGVRPAEVPAGLGLRPRSDHPARPTAHREAARTLWPATRPPPCRAARWRAIPHPPADASGNPGDALSRPSVAKGARSPPANERLGRSGGLPLSRPTRRSRAVPRPSDTLAGRLSCQAPCGPPPAACVVRCPLCRRTSQPSGQRRATPPPPSGGGMGQRGAAALSGALSVRLCRAARALSASSRRRLPARTPSPATVPECCASAPARSSADTCPGGQDNWPRGGRISPSPCLVLLCPAVCAGLRARPTPRGGSGGTSPWDAGGG